MGFGEEQFFLMPEVQNTCNRGRWLNESGCDGVKAAIIRGTRNWPKINLGVNFQPYLPL